MVKVFGADYLPRVGGAFGFGRGFDFACMGRDEEAKVSLCVLDQADRCSADVTDDSSECPSFVGVHMFSQPEPEGLRHQWSKPGWSGAVFEVPLFAYFFSLLFKHL